ncbi:MAG: pyruvate kinase [Flavobacteriales bacterium]
MKKTKIIATIGPASVKRSMLKKMIQRGVNVCRINFSHSNHRDAREIIELVRELNDELNTNVAILGDLQGPKIRIDDVEAGVVLHANEKLNIQTKKIVGTAKQVSISSYPNFAKDVQKGDVVRIDDGKIDLEVLKTNGVDQVKLKVVHGGPLSSKKGVNLPDTKLSTPSLTRKDLKDLHFAIGEDIEWIGLSFVRHSDDILSLQSILKSRESASRVVAKIEKPEAISDLERIVQLSGAVMIARGDLGVEVPMERVPSIQKRIIRMGMRHATPVIVATQMMESMIESASPTRAEVNDVAGAVYDGADAVMLSGETSVGKYPLEVIDAMVKIINEVEGSGEIVKQEFPPIDNNERFITNSICYQACKLADQVKAKAIMCMTHTGFNAFKISSHRPDAEVFVFTHNKNILNTLSLLWGTHGFYYNETKDSDSTMKDLHQKLKKTKYIKKHDLVINVASMPVKLKGKTNMLKLTAIE